MVVGKFTCHQFLGHFSYITIVMNLLTYLQESYRN